MALAYPDPPLADGRIALRRWEATDTALVVEAGLDPYVAEIEKLPAADDATGVRAWIEARGRTTADGRGWSFVVVARPAGEAVGAISLTIRHPRVAEAGCFILQRARNAGFAEHATVLVSRWGLLDGGLARVQATVEPWNSASQRVLAKVGFVREGLLRSYATFGARTDDAFMYSLVRGAIFPRRVWRNGPRRRGAMGGARQGRREFAYSHYVADGGHSIAPSSAARRHSGCFATPS